MFKVIEDLSQFLLKHPTKTYAFRDTSSIDRIVVHQTAGEDEGKFTAYNIANDHVNNNDWAGIGYHYDGVGFYCPKPFDCWTLNKTTCIWEPPSAHPDDWSKQYVWDEPRLQWKEVTG